MSPSTNLRARSWMSRSSLESPYMAPASLCQHPATPPTGVCLTDRSVYAIVGSMGESADVVVVGGGTIGGWCGAFLGAAGAGRVVLLERTRLGRGASSRAAGMVRAQGGTEIAVKLGIWSIDFYRRQRDEIGFDSGFVEQGYFMPAFDE